MAAFTAVVSGFPLALVVPTGAGAAPRPAPAGTATDENAAVRTAKQSGERVEALSERTEYSQVFAEPSGQLTYEATAVPQRIRRADGSWTGVDADLVADGGTLRPIATLADVHFSAGGDGPLVTWKQDGKDLTMSWPLGALPTPSITGDSATYPSILPDVDLVVRATRTGFAHVLVVKSPAAAANPAVRELRFDVGGDARMQRLPDGKLQAVAGKRLMAMAAVPQMWDSTAPANGKANVAKSTFAVPGDAARGAELGTTIDDNGDLVLRPDPALLTKATFPVFIDPEWSTGRTRWAYATHNNTNNTDTSVARVGADPDGRLYRSFVEFPTSAIKGKYVDNAYVQMVVDHSYSCTNTPNSMYQAATVSGTPRTSFSTSLIKYLTSASSHANEGSGCSDSPQPNMTVNFTGSNVTSTVNSLAGSGASAMTFGFTARDSDGSSESDGTRWKKYLPSGAKLIATVDAKPAVPNSLQVNGVACGAEDMTVGSTSPYFSAYLPDADGTQQTLRATWTVYKAADDGTVSNPVVLPVTSATANTRGFTAKIAARAEGRYAFTVKTTDPFDIGSPTTSPCYFRIDSTVPDVGVTVVDAPEGPGKPVRVTFTSAAKDVTKFRYGWNDAVPYEVAATAIKDATGTVIRNEASATLTTASYGLAVVYVRAIDAAGNFASGSGSITVPRPSPAVARWGLETTPAADQASAMLDQQPALAGDNQLTGPTSWTDKGRIVGAGNLTFTGTTALTTPKFLDTTKSFAVAAWVRLDNVGTAQTVMSQDGANVAGFQLGFRPDDLTGDGIADKSWCFGMSPSDSAAATYVRACAIDSAVAGRWTHVAGAYDATMKKLQIWVDGRNMAEAVAPTTWAANGSLRIGNRKITTTAYGDGLTGSAADVQVFDRVLVSNDFTGTRADEPLANGITEPGILSPIKVGSWDFETAWPCIDTTDPSSCLADDADFTPWSQRFRFTPGTGIDDGQQDARSMAFDNVLGDGEPPTTEYGVAQRNVGTQSAPQWQDTPVVRTDYSFSVSVSVKPARLADMTAVAQRGTAQSAFYIGTRSSKVGGVTGTRFEVTIPSVDQATGLNDSHLLGRTVLTDQDLNRWWHLTFVYDTASNTQLRFYVDDKLESSRSGALWAANGALTIGGGWSTPSGGTAAITDQWFGSIDDLDIQQGVTATDGTITPSYPDMAIRDFTGDQFSDILARNSGGTVYLYGGDGIGNLKPKIATSGSFSSYDLMCSPGDFDGDGVPDLFGRTSAGTLMMHRANGTGDWLNTTGTEVGSGFGSFNAIVTPGDFNGDGNADIIGRNSAGDLVLLGGNGKGAWITGRGLKIGSGFQVFDMLFSPGDFTGDGYPDLMARKSTGELYYYAGNGNGGWLTGGKVQIGTGFNAYNMLFSPGDLNGDGNPDVIGRTSNGDLKIYGGNGSGHWINNQGIGVGTGWNTFNAIF